MSAVAVDGGAERMLAGVGSFAGLRDMSLGACIWMVVLAGCEGPPPAPVAAPTDKRALYGDPGLVPTRAGERAREELARAGSVAAALRARAEVRALAVEVRLPTPGDPGAAVIAGELSLDTATVTRIAEGVLGPWSAGRVQVELTPPAGAVEREDVPIAAERAEPRWWPRWALGVALVGLGLSAGVSIERVRQRRASGR